MFHRLFALVSAALVSGALLAGPALAQDPAAPPLTEAHYATARAMIADRQKIVTPNGIQVAEQVTLNGLPQWISIRGADRANPVIIYVHGGPGATEMGRSWPYQQGWRTGSPSSSGTSRAPARPCARPARRPTAPTCRAPR